MRRFAENTTATQQRSLTGWPLWSSVAASCNNAPCGPLRKGDSLRSLRSKPRFTFASCAVNTAP